MRSRDDKDLTDLDDWLEHIDTVVLGHERERSTDVDSPAEEQEQPSRS